MKPIQDYPLQAFVSPGPEYVPFPAEALAGNVPERFEALVQQGPDRLAVQDSARQLTYDQLNRQANRLAHAILQTLGPGSEPVGLLHGPGVQAIVSLLATLKAGKIYLPFDPTDLDEQIAGRLNDAGARLVLTTHNLLAQTERLSGRPLKTIAVDRLEPGLSADNLQLKIEPDSGLNLMYTSGSSGQPKGVLQTHRNALYLAYLVADIQKNTPQDRFSLIIPYTFGASAADIFGALLCGASLHIFDVKSQGIHRLADWLCNEEITIYHSVPTIFRQLLNTINKQGSMPRMRCIKLGGEPVVKRDIELFKQYFSPSCVVQHALGTTETYLSACWMVDHQTQVSEAVVPIGYPTAGTRISLIDEQGQAVPDGEIGQIAIHSRYLSPGYWNKPDLTRAAFLPDPEDPQARTYLSGDLGRINSDGLLEYLGRKDGMIKIHGQRIEPAEIELALREIEGIKDAVVVAFTPADGQTRLAAYIVSGSQRPPDSNTIRRLLASKLPAAMLPQVITRLERMPLLPFGKINRNALPPPIWGGANAETRYLPPETPTQITLAQIFAETLRPVGSGQTPRVGLLDNYFDLGGDSLAAIDLNLRIEAACQVHLTLQNLVENPTVADLARFIDHSFSQGLPEQSFSEEEGLQRALRLLGY